MLEFNKVKSTYKGKVREIYAFENNKMLAIASDRISAFDVILPREIPFKGQVLNKIAAYFLDATKDIVPNWLESMPFPNASYGNYCEPIKIEMVIRGYLTGHAWRLYKSGVREICGNILPDGMKEHQKLDNPIITPATKAEEGHDEDISPAEIVNQEILDAATFKKLEQITRALYGRGVAMAHDRGLILVDTKYEFGILNGEVVLIDEIHTPDSSRYFYENSYADNFNQGLAQRQLSKEFVREWLIENNFQGLEGQTVPEMTDEFVASVTQRYIELYETITGNSFKKEEVPSDDVIVKQINAMH
jgi:phosphoribosylaminoimidazole-succinocarboxamide synthase